MAVLLVGEWREQGFAREEPGMVPGNQLGSLSRELEMTPRGVLGWADLVVTTAGSELAPLPPHFRELC